MSKLHGFQFSSVVNIIKSALNQHAILSLCTFCPEKSHFELIENESDEEVESEVEAESDEEVSDEEVESEEESVLHFLFHVEVPVTFGVSSNAKNWRPEPSFGTQKMCSFFLLEQSSRQ